MRINYINNLNIPKINSRFSFGEKAVSLYMLDESGHVSKYPSIKEVSLALGVSEETIRKALEGNKKVSGVILKKAKDVEKKK